MDKGLKTQNFRILSGSVLKVIAVVSMLIDHTAHVLGPELAWMTEPLLTLGGRTVTLYYLMRKVGRLAFPIFCFLVTEGFVHTRAPGKYCRNLLVFAVLSELPFNLMISGSVLAPGRQNVYFTLLLGTLLCWLFAKGKNGILKPVLMLAVGIAALVLKADYGLEGACLILLLYALREHAAAQAVLAYPLLSGGVAAFLAFVPINLYNGQRGFIRSPFLKYGFYLFYPVHILALVLIKAVI